jgi:hypothetical protein
LKRLLFHSPATPGASGRRRNSLFLKCPGRPGLVFGQRHGVPRAAVHPFEDFEMTAIHRPGAASAAVLIALSVSMVIAHAIAPSWSRRVGLDVWNIAALEEEYRAAADEQADVLSQAERASARRAAGNQVAAKLITGSVSLSEAAVELIEVFREDEGTQITLASIHTGAPTERHVFARHAIDRVRALLVADPAQSDAVVARLEVEYRVMCAAPESPRAP